MRVVASFLLWSLAAAAQVSNPDALSSLAGHVQNAETGQPLGKVSLLMVRVDSVRSTPGVEREYTATSDSTGKFSISNVEPGRYILSASRNGYATLHYGAHGSQLFGTQFDLLHPQQLNDIDFRLVPYGIVAGRVTDSDGDPVPTARVQLLRYQYNKGKRTLSTSKSVYTNDLGEYRCAGLISGRYYVYAENFAQSPAAPKLKEDFIPVYYPGATNAADAVPVEVPAGKQILGVDILLRKAATVTVKGRVLIEVPGVQGTPTVRFFPRAGHDDSSSGSFRSPTARVDSTNGFEIRNLTPGSYFVMAEISKEGQSFTGQTTVEVANTNIESITLTIPDLVSMSGRIQVDGNFPHDLSKIAIRLLSGGPGLDASPFQLNDPVAQDLTFHIDRLRPNRYGILVDNLPNGFYTKSIRAGGADIRYSGVDLSAGSIGSVDILLNPNAGFIAGVVRGPDSNQPASGATVALVPKEEERLRLGEFYRQSATDQDGHFELKNIIPGEYKLYSWEDVEPGAWMDPEFLKPLEAKAQSLVIEENSRLNLPINLILK